MKALYGPGFPHSRPPSGRPLFLVNTITGGLQLSRRIALSAGLSADWIVSCHSRRLNRFAGPNPWSPRHPVPTGAARCSASLRSDDRRLRPLPAPCLSHQSLQRQRNSVLQVAGWATATQPLRAHDSSTARVGKMHTQPHGATPVILRAFKHFQVQASSLCVA